MSNSQDVRRALENRLNAGSYTGITNSTDIAWENVQFDPTAKSAWLRPRLQIAEMLPATVSSGLAVRWTGVFFVDCFVKQNTGGTAVLDDLADDVLAQFAYGTQLTENSKIINIRFAERAGFINDEPWVMCPVTMTWYGFIS